MYKRLVTRSAIVMAFMLLFAGPAISQDITIGDMTLDKIAWGVRTLTVPVENLRDDTAHIRVAMQTFYPGHYLSGLDRMEKDTTVSVGPKESALFVMPFEIQGSFGRVASQAVVSWRFDNYDIPEGQPDSVFQRFSKAFIARGDAAFYGGLKHSLGPVYSTIDHFLMNFEYPRLVLFLLARGETVDRINTIFASEMDYTQRLLQTLRIEGYFPLADDTLAPGILAVTEKEGYALKEDIKAASQAFAQWYDSKGQAELRGCFEKAGIDPYVQELPSLQMAIVLTLLKEDWVDKAHGFDIPHFDDIQYDLRAQNQPRWIVQGGEFFLPKLCLAPFEQNGNLHFGTFSPDPSLPYDKAPIYDLRQAAEQDAKSIIMLDVEQIRTVLKEAKDKMLTGELAEKFKPIIEKAQGEIATFKPYLAPNLADYVFESALGDYFIGHKPGEGLDCFQIKYQP